MKKYLLLVTIIPFISVINLSFAEIVLDGSLGTDGQIAGPNFSIDSSYGSQEGGNLFHSFSTFNVTNGESATFNGPNSVSNIIGRVTGGDFSNIDGMVKSNIAGANLWLVNSAGIVFGENASIDVDGSFHASTADYLVFDDEGQFITNSASNSNLTVANPIGFGFLTEQPAPIFVNGANISSALGKEISLVAGEVTLTDATVNSSEGQINIVSIGGVGEINFVDPDNFQQSHLKFGDNVSGDNIELTNSQVLITDDSVGSNQGGDIYILGGSLYIDKQSSLQHTNGNNINGVINIIANDVLIEGLFQSNSIGDGNGANIVVNGDEVTISNKSTDLATITTSGLVSSATGNGDGGSIHITSNAVSIAGDGGSSVGGIVRSFASGNAIGGDVNINADTLSVVNNGKIFTSAFFSGGTSGSININASNNILVSGEDSKIETQTFGNADSNNIEINIQSKDFTLTDSAQISTDSFSAGKGAGIKIDVVNLTVSDKAVLNARTFDDTGQGMDINVSEKLIVSNDASISTDTFNDGIGSNINIIAADLDVIYGGRISASTKRNGSAGSVNIDVTNNILLEGSGEKLSGIFSESGVVSDTFQPGEGQPEYSGAGGDVIVSANNLEIKGGAVISGEAINIGNAGNISLDIDKLLLIDASSIETKANKSSGGNIVLSVGDMLNMSNSEVTASANGVTTGDDGGNVLIQGVLQEDSNGVVAGRNKPRFIIQDNSDITARANAGNGGNITLSSGQVVGSTLSIVDASSQKGIDGEILIESPMQDMSAAVVNLNTSFIDLSALLNSPCAVSAVKNKSSFTVKKQYQLPPKPDSYESGRSRLIMVNNSGDINHVTAFHNGHLNRNTTRECL